MKVLIVSGGPETLVPDHFLDDGSVRFVGVDAGVIYLLDRGITPDAGFGDFDSISEKELERIEHAGIHLHTFEKEKDKTDLELAIDWALEQKPRSVYLYGATGGRLDHGIVNIQLLTKGFDNGVHMEVIDRNNRIFLKMPGSYSIWRDDHFPYVSFLPFSEHVTGITLSGFKYSLEEADMKWGSTLCISNELVTKKGTYSFSGGIIMVVRSND
ncbi:thiamine diphosphokinase [Pseudalkalibacillus sp. SCS-8]|uniref:thiamine diphosphokinase n=1 Tax=Pseudalkalibacillus nanhaiensis TaxID=3115291 RepID=UPI0032DAA61C